MPEKYQYFNNIKFTRDDKTGYYRNSNILKRIHTYVWEYYNGEVPKGYHIHHIDGDKSNNNIENLQLMLAHDHYVEHSKRLTEEQRNWRRNNLNTKARPKAIEWHKSEEGRKWHSEHTKKQREQGVFKKDLICTNCGKSYIGEVTSSSKNTFCCNACKSAYRRKMGLDLVNRECIICGKVFKANKYSKTVTCSPSCANRYKWRKKNESKDSEKHALI